MVVFERSRQLLVGVCLAAAVLCAPVSVRAQSAPDGLGLSQFEAGKRAFDAGDFEGALAAFSASLASMPSPNTRLYIARCQRALGRVASAFTQFKLAAREAQDRLGATGEKRYSATRDAAAGEAAELEPRVPRLTVTVPSDLPADFELSVGGRALPRSAWGVALEVDPGSVVVVASGHRTKRFHKQLPLAEGERQQVAVRLERLPTATLVLRFKTRPEGLSVELDGQPVSASALDSPRELDPGQHTISVRAPGHAPFEWKRSLADKQNIRVDVALKQVTQTSGAQGTPRWLFYGVAGASLAALAGGTYFAFSAQSADTTERDKDPLVRTPSAQDSISGQATLANVLFVGGGVLAVGAGILGFTTDWSEVDDHDAARTWIGLSGLGAQAGGRF